MHSRLAEVSTHNVEALSERNDTHYDQMPQDPDEGEGEGGAEQEERPLPLHQTTLGLILSRGTDAVQTRLAGLMQAIDKSDTMQRLQARCRPPYENHIRPSLSIGHLNVTLASENLAEPIESVGCQLQIARSRVSSFTTQVQQGITERWRAATSSNQR